MYIVKIGGSLMYDCEDLINTLKNYCSKSNKKIVIIPGGGRFADIVRELYKLKNLDDIIAHKLSTLSTDIYGEYISYIGDIPKSDNLHDTKNILKYNNIVVLLPSKIILGTDELPNNWNITSDSFAGYIGKLLKVDKLIIATDVDGIYDKYPEGKILYTISVKSIKGFTSIDEYLPKLLIKHNIECYVVNGKYPKRVISILEGRKDIYTKIVLN